MMTPDHYYTDWVHRRTDAASFTAYVEEHSSLGVFAWCAAVLYWALVLLFLVVCCPFLFGFLQGMFSPAASVTHQRSPPSAGQQSFSSCAAGVSQTAPVTPLPSRSRAARQSGATSRHSTVHRANTTSRAASTGTCAVCLEDPCDTIFTGCGHLCLCGQCLGRMQHQGDDRCPICRQQSRTSHVYTT